MNPEIEGIWVYLSASPLLWLTLTLLAYQVAYRVYARASFNPLLNPVAWSVAALVAVLQLSGTSYEKYFGGAQFIHFLLGPATVALAVPLYQQLENLRRHLLPLLGGLLAGSLTAILSAVGVAAALGGSRETLLSLAPKSITTPIAMGVAEKIGGIPSLTAVLVVTTGIAGAVMARFVFDAMGIKDHIVRGFATGIAAHGIGTARAFQESAQMGAFSGLAMGLNGLVTAVLLPVMVSLVRF